MSPVMTISTSLLTIFFALCWSWHSARASDLRCSIKEFDDKAIRYQLSRLPGKNCTSFWDANGKVLVSDEGKLEDVVAETGDDFMVTKNCLAGVKYMGHCFKDQFPEAKCEGVCPTAAPLKGTTTEVGNASGVLHPSNLVLLLALGLILFAV